MLEVAEHVQSPFGVFMFAGSYEVVIIPNDRSNRNLVELGIQQSRAVLLQKERGDLIPPPTGNQCAGCRLGYPLFNVPGESDRHLDVVPGEYTPRYDARKRERHSVCGDRFGWCPSHGKWKEIGE